MKKVSAREWVKRCAPGLAAVAALGLGYLGGLANQPPPPAPRTIVKTVEVIKTVPALAPAAAPAPAPVTEPEKRKRAPKRKAEEPPKKFLGIF